MYNKYVYVYLNTLKPGNFEYENLKFEYEPFYVGMGSGDRYKMHKYDCKLRSKSHKINTIKKIINNKLEPIIIKLYENLSNDEAKSLEIKTIKEIGRKDLKLGPLSNRTDGGDSTGYKHNKKDLVKAMNSILCYDLNMKLLKEYNSIQDASDDLNITRSNISQCCRYLFNVCDKKYIFRYKNIKKDKEYQDKNIVYRIIRIDYKGNIKKYKRAIDAYKDTGISQNTITKVCKGRYLNGGGFIWRYTHYDKSFYEEIESDYNFIMSKMIMDSDGNIFLNSLHASIKTVHTLRRICQNLEGNYKLHNINFEYVN